MKETGDAACMSRLSFLDKENVLLRNGWRTCLGLEFVDRISQHLWFVRQHDCLNVSSKLQLPGAWPISSKRMGD